MTTEDKVLKVLEVLNALGTVNDTGFAGPRLRILLAHSAKTVEPRFKAPVHPENEAVIWASFFASFRPSSQTYVCEFKLDVGRNAPADEIRGAAERLIELKAKVPTFDSVETREVLAALDKHVGVHKRS